MLCLVECIQVEIQQFKTDLSKRLLAAALSPRFGIAGSSMCLTFTPDTLPHISPKGFVSPPGMKLGMFRLFGKCLNPPHYRASETDLNNLKISYLVSCTKKSLKTKIEGFQVWLLEKRCPLGVTSTHLYH